MSSLNDFLGMAPLKYHFPFGLFCCIMALSKKFEEDSLMKYGFGVDLGGTTVKIAYFDETGKMLSK